jgi:yecA family protein
VLTQTSCGFDELEERLQAADADCGAAEAHGLLCGTIAAGGRTGPDVWLEHLLGEGNTLSVATQDCSDTLVQLQADILGQFNDEDFGFSALLPADATPLTVRTRALSQWCEGFLYGLALGGVREGGVQADTVQEVMQDFYEISHAGFVAEAPDGVDESAYAEIVEYVRMSVLQLHEELQAVPASPRLQ